MDMRACVILMKRGVYKHDRCAAHCNNWFCFAPSVLGQQQCLCLLLLFVILSTSNVPLFNNGCVLAITDRRLLQLCVH